MGSIQFISPAKRRRVILLANQGEDTPIFLSGSAGTGKQAIAHWMHLNSARARAPFCVARQEQSLGEQIIGADGGSLLVPEIQDWPLAEQEVLLNYLKKKTIRYSEQPSLVVLARTRIFALSSRDLTSCVKARRFDWELCELLSTFHVEIPDLKTRKKEIRNVLIAMFQEVRLELKKYSVRGLSEAALKLLQSYTWPGNIQELRQTMQTAIMKTTSNEVQAEQFAYLQDFSPRSIALEFWPKQSSSEQLPVIFLKTHPKS